VNDPNLPFKPRGRAQFRAHPRRTCACAAATGDGAGSGQRHRPTSAHFAAAQPGWTWQPTEADSSNLPAIAARCAGLGQRVRTAAAGRDGAALAGASGQLRRHLLRQPAAHRTLARLCAALMAGAARHLAPGGALVLYGPYVVDGASTAPGNLAFDADLRARDPAWACAGWATWPHRHAGGPGAGQALQHAGQQSVVGLQARVAARLARLSQLGVAFAPIEPFCAQVLMLKRMRCAERL